MGEKKTEEREQENPGRAHQNNGYFHKFTPPVDGASISQ
jgi:hypothetical protein